MGLGGASGSWCTIYRRGEAGRLRGKVWLGGRPSIGDMLRSAVVDVSSTASTSLIPPNVRTGRTESFVPPDMRFGRPGKTSSAGFLGIRTRFGEFRGLDGLAGR